MDVVRILHDAFSSKNTSLAYLGSTAGHLGVADGGVGNAIFRFHLHREGNIPQWLLSPDRVINISYIISSFFLCCQAVRLTEIKNVTVWLTTLPFREENMNNSDSNDALGWSAWSHHVLTGFYRRLSHCRVQLLTLGKHSLLQFSIYISRYLL